MAIEPIARTRNQDYLLWYSEIGVRLYLPSDKFQQQHRNEESEQVMELLSAYDLQDSVPVTFLDEMDGRTDYFGQIKNPSSPLRLPFLEVAYGCTTGAVLGHTGYEEIKPFFDENRTRFVGQGNIIEF